MRKNKFIKLIEHILVALPLLMVLVTCCYIIWNSNANQSYYGENINQRQVDFISSMDELEVNKWYHFDSRNFVNPYSTSQGSYAQRIYFSQFRNLETYGVTIVDTETFDFINPYISNEGVLSVYLRYFNNQVISLRNNTYIAFDFVFSSSTEGYNVASTNVLQSISYNNYSYLSSAFEYSLSEFNNMGFGKINFTGFFVDMFHNGQSNVYIDFANSYLNYMLFIECTFVLPLVLYWFIHIGENILYKFEKGEW